MSRILVIYNPVAGRGRVQENWPKVEQGLKDAGIDFDVSPTQNPRNAIELAEKAYGRYSAVVAVGGDGTVHEVVNGLLRGSKEGETLPLGIIPLGNGDDFAKIIPPATAIGSKPFEWQEAIRKIAGGQTQLFDVGRMTSDNPRPDFGGDPHYFMNIIDVGFGAVATQYFLTIPKFIKGMAAYMLMVLKTLINYPALALRIQLDDQAPFEQTVTILAVANGRCFGSGFWVTPDASAEDGLFDVAFVQKVGRLAILNLIPKLMKGTHIHEPVVNIKRARRVLIESKEPLIVEADGEMPYLDIRRMEVTILPKRLRVLV